MISIHKALAGLDGEEQTLIYVLEISIHKALAGLDYYLLSTPFKQVRFQSTRPSRASTH